MAKTITSQNFEEEVLRNILKELADLDVNYKTRIN